MQVDAEAHGLTVARLIQRTQETAKGGRHPGEPPCAGRIAMIAVDLARIAHQVHRLDERACNFGELPKRDETRVDDLLAQARVLAAEMGAHAYHQGDPRGRALYILFPGDTTDNYINGVCISY